MEVLGLSGPAVVGVDSIHLALIPDWRGVAAQPADATVHQVVHALAALHDHVRRGFLVVAALPSTWEVLRSRSAGQLTDRFDEPVTLRGVASEVAALQLVAGRLGQQFEQIGACRPTSRPRPNSTISSDAVSPTTPSRWKSGSSGR